MDGWGCSGCVGIRHSAMRYAYSTLFDASYASRGLLMGDSLARHLGPDDSLTVFAVDAEAERVARAHSAGRSRIRVLPLMEIATQRPEFARIAQVRSRAELCWTAASLSLSYLLQRDGPEMAVYIDADLRFYSDPARLLHQLVQREHHTLITPHGFPASADRSADVGTYCVQFMPFRNTAQGREILEAWCTDCLADCSYTPGSGQCGDQTHLDDWPTRWRESVWVCHGRGVGAGPWNASLHGLRRGPAGLETRLPGEPGWSPLLFYHFQNIKFDPSGSLDRRRLLSWPMPYAWLRLVHTPYLAELSGLQSELGLRPPLPPGVGLRSWLSWLRNR